MNRKVRFAGSDLAACVECGQPREPEMLDRQLWCDECRRLARAVATRWGRIIGLVGTLALVIWIGQSVAPTGRMLVAWAVVILVTYRILGRLGRELVYTVLRARVYRAAAAKRRRGPGEDA